MVLHASTEVTARAGSRGRAVHELGGDLFDPGRMVTLTQNIKHVYAGDALRPRRSSRRWVFDGQDLTVTPEIKGNILTRRKEHVLDVAGAVQAVQGGNFP
jgi:hypothetical protein